MMHPLRILMICHMPWSRNLGGPRVQVELADEFRAAGHKVEKFSYEDAFPRGRSRLGDLLDPRAFARSARAFVRRHGSRFDVIDCHQGNLPYTKRDLIFSGLLVARSVGLYAFYEDFAREEAMRWPDRARGSWAGGLLRALKARRLAPDYPRSLQTSDLINLCNWDELRYVSDVLGLGDRCVCLPFGMSRERQTLFEQERASAGHRLMQETVAFIGYWGLRKGSADWPEIVRRVWAERPRTRFLFLGTGGTRDVVHSQLGLEKGDERIRVVSAYYGDQLPGLLRDATVGAFPSYIEGFPFAVLELLAAGLPTVTYDVPGPREMLSDLDPTWMVSPGDAATLADRLLDLLRRTPADYQNLSEACIASATRFSWDSIAQRSLETYNRLVC